MGEMRRQDLVSLVDQDGDLCAAIDYDPATLKGAFSLTRMREDVHLNEIVSRHFRQFFLLHRPSRGL